MLVLQLIKFFQNLHIVSQGLRMKLFPHIQFFIFLILLNTRQINTQQYEYPLKIAILMDKIATKTEQQNRMLFYGPPGTGKTTTIEAIVEQTQSKVIIINCSELVTKYAGGASDKLLEIFQQAERFYNDPKNQQRRVIIVFEEVDGIGGKITPENQQNDSQRTAGIQTLWGNLDKYRNESDPERKFLFIFTTNHIENIEPAFLERLPYQFEFKKPDEHERQIFLNKFLQEIGEENKYTSKELHNFAKSSKGLSIRQLKNIVDSCRDSVRSGTFAHNCIESEVKETINKGKSNQPEPWYGWNNTGKNIHQGFCMGLPTMAVMIGLACLKYRSEKKA